MKDSQIRANISDGKNKIANALKWTGRADARFEERLTGKRAETLYYSDQEDMLTMLRHAKRKLNEGVADINTAIREMEG